MYLKTLSTAAAIMALAAATAAAGPAARAETSACADGCISIYNDEIGSGYLLAVQDQTLQQGQPIILSPVSTANPGEDFAIEAPGTVDDYYAAGEVSDKFDKHYGSDWAFQLEYAPEGVESGLCAGTAVVAGQHSLVSLQPCGASSQIIWAVADSSSYSSAAAALASGYSDLINGSNTNFSRPYVLTYPRNSYPAGHAQPQLYTALLGAAGTPESRQQLWSDAP